MKRRTQLTITPQRLFNEALNTPLQWPWKTVRLERSSLLDYRQRPSTVHFSVAELYHENSKLFPQMLPELAVARVEGDEFRHEAIQRRTTTVRSRLTAALGLDPACRELLSAVATAIDPKLLYGIELRVVVGKSLGAYEPMSDWLYLVRTISARDLAALRQALQLLASPGAPAHNGPLLFIIGAFARNDVLLGVRGYRRTLVEAGQVAQEVLRQAARLSLAVHPLYEFSDRAVDAAIQADGVEEGTIVVFELGEVSDAS